MTKARQTVEEREMAALVALCGKSEAEVAAYYAAEERDFYTSRGNYIGGGAGAKIDGHYAAGGFDPNETEGHDEAAMGKREDLGLSAAGERLVAALYEIRKSYGVTAEALVGCLWNYDAGTPVFEDLGAKMGISGPSAYGRYKSLRKVCEERPELLALLREARSEASFSALHEAALRMDALRDGIED